MRALAAVGLARSPVLHAVYYLAAAAGDGLGYSFRLEGFGVYSPELARDAALGRLRPIARRAAQRLASLVASLCGDGLRVDCGYAIVAAARVHFVATQVYPPVDDPVEYVSMRFPGMDRWVAERALRALRVAGLL